MLRLAVGSKRLVESRVKGNGLQLCGYRDLAKDVGRSRLALLGPVGQCAPAHSVHLLDRSREAWAAWRALFLLCQEGAGGGFGRSAVQSLCLCGNAQGVRADWSAPIGSRR